ncbi:MAG: hypothetical protein EPO12_06980 [Aquabacterium sp.]|nr:MAG: hypothetical protein EPO12_06980 [Aquabacterium sp.]
MITKIWLYPPLAFARVGGAAQACDNFHWEDEDLSPTGTGRTRIAAATTLDVAADGSLRARQPDVLSFKSTDAKTGPHFRPVSPFFELHGEWTDGYGQQQSGPITTALLSELGYTPRQLRWTVKVANLKAWHFTGSQGDIVRAEVSMAGDGDGGKYQAMPLLGHSPAVEPRLVPAGHPIPMGQVQLVRPQDKWPGLRMRFTPPAGLVYAPSDLDARLGRLDEIRQQIQHTADELAGALGPLGPLVQALAGMLLKGNELWRGFALPDARKILNPKAAWPQWAWPGTPPLDIAAVVARLQDPGFRIDGLLGHGDQSELIRNLGAPDADAHNMPLGIFAYMATPAGLLSSMGFVDDISDGVITVELEGAKLEPARARVVVAPPCLAPDRRMPVSVADGLADRVARAEAREDAWVRGDNEQQSDAEVHDIFERALETAWLQNVDAACDFFDMENRNRAAHLGNQAPPVPQLWKTGPGAPGDPLPLTTQAREAHRRLATPSALQAYARRGKDWLTQLRDPGGDNLYYDRAMPGLMRGSDRRPLHLTRRQVELLKQWTRRVRELDAQPAPAPASDEGQPS